MSSAFAYTNIRSSNFYIDVRPIPSRPRNAHYTFGDPIRGAVRIHPTTRPQRVKLHFKGRTKLGLVAQSGNTSHTYKEKILFFTRSLELFRSPVRQSYDILQMGSITSDNRVELPFEFTIPETVELKPPEIFKKREGFEWEAGHALPPSYRNTHKGADQIVEYYLEAQMYQDFHGEASHTVRQKIELSPPSPKLSADDLLFAGFILPPKYGAHAYQVHRNFRVQTHRLHPDFDPSEDFLTRMKHRWTKSNPSTPHVTFKITAQVPRLAVVGELLPITFSLTHVERSDIIKEPPPIYLTRVRVQFASILRMRVPRISAFRGVVEDLDDECSDKRDLIDLHYNQPGALLYDGMDLRELMNNKLNGLRIGTWVVPNFQSIGLNLRHQIKVNIWGRCAQEKFERVVCAGAIDVMSGLERVVDDECAAGPSTTAAPPDITAAEEDAPPAYEEAPAGEASKDAQS